MDDKKKDFWVEPEENIEEVKPVGIKKETSVAPPVRSKGASSRYYVTATVNVCSSPDGGDLLGYQSAGEVIALEEKDDWVRTDRGWLSKRFLKSV